MKQKIVLKGLIQYQQMVQNLVIQQALATPLYFHAMTKIIAPHGITDIVHAQQYKTYKPLFCSYLGSIGCGQLLHVLHLDPIWNTCFFGMSILHFQHDFSYFNWKQRMTISTLFIVSFYYFSFTPFYLYMLLLHVPNHYRMAWDYVKYNIPLTIALVSITSFCTEKMFQSNVDMSFIISVVIGHILYEEIEVHSIWKNLFLKQHPPR